MVPANFDLLVAAGDEVSAGDLIAVCGEDSSADELVYAPRSGVVGIQGHVVSIGGSDGWDAPVPQGRHVVVASGATVRLGQPLTDGTPILSEMLHLAGPLTVARYIVDQVQEVYRSQGVTIHDKHLEVIVRQMLQYVLVEDPGDTGFFCGDVVGKAHFISQNAAMLAAGGTVALATPLVMGITKAALAREGFLAPAAFQDTARILRDAAISNVTDHITGIMEHVIVGQRVPGARPLAGTPAITST